MVAGKRHAVANNHLVLDFVGTKATIMYWDTNSLYATFEEDFIKRMNNGVFGKTVENLKKRIRLEMVNPSEVMRMNS